MPTWPTLCITGKLQYVHHKNCINHVMHKTQCHKLGQVNFGFRKRLRTKMAFDNSLYDYDAGYYMYQFQEGSFWLPGKMVPNGRATWGRRAVDAAINVDLDDSDILIATYPKTGLYCMAFLHLKCNLHFNILTNAVNSSN